MSVRWLNDASGASWRYVASSTRCSAATRIDTSERAVSASTDITALGNLVINVSIRGCIVSFCETRATCEKSAMSQPCASRHSRSPRGLFHKHLFALDFFLQLQQAVHQRFGPRRAARHIDIDRDDLIDALHHR